MIARALLFAASTLVVGAATATPAQARPNRVGVDLARGRIVVHAEWGRDHAHGRHGGHGPSGSRVYARIPVRTVHRHGHDCHWVESRYEVRITRVWVPGYVREEYVPPVYEERIGRRGVRYRVLVREGYIRRIEVPGHYESREDRVLVPGHWSCCG